MSNIYQKLQEARCELQEMNLKKSGNNKFSGYTYYELGDFLPAINALLKKYKLFSDISFGDMAVLTITNAEKPDEKITFLSTIAEANLKGCHPIQNLGAIQTYLRRYLYMNAFEIVEHDLLDAVTDTKKEIKQEVQEKENITKKLGTMIMDLAGNDKEKAKELFKQFTSFTDKDGKFVEGKETLKGMSDKAIQVAYGKVKAEWLKLNK